MWRRDRAHRELELEDVLAQLGDRRLPATPAQHRAEVGARARPRTAVWAAKARRQPTERSGLANRPFCAYDESVSQSGGEPRPSRSAAACLHAQSG